MLSPRLLKLRKVVLISLACAAGIALILAVTIYAVSTWKLSRHHEASATALRVTPVVSMAVEGARLAHVVGCFGCHGDSLTGRLFVEQFLVGRLSAPNLTRIVPHYTDQQIVDVIRSGVRSDGTGVVFMPSHTFVRLADADIAAIVAYLRTLESRPDAAQDASFGLLPRALIVAGLMPIEPDVVDRGQVGPAMRPSDAAALGPYVAKTVCAICHGGDLRGDKQMQSPNLFAITPAYSPADFKTLMSTGIAIGGRKLGSMTEMSQAALKYMRDDEMAAVYTYLAATDAAKIP